MSLAGYMVLQKVTPLGTFPFKVETETNISDSKAREHTFPPNVKDSERAPPWFRRPGTDALLFRTGFISTVITL